jgi:hypothetical protein
MVEARSVAVASPAPKATKDFFAALKSKVAEIEDRHRKPSSNSAAFESLVTGKQRRRR